MDGDHLSCTAARRDNARYSLWPSLIGVRVAKRNPATTWWWHGVWLVALAGLTVLAAVGDVRVESGVTPTRLRTGSSRTGHVAIRKNSSLTNGYVSTYGNRTHIG